MTVMQITLLALGVIIFALSFIVSDMNSNKSEKDLKREQEEIRKLMEQELSNMTMRVNEATNETVEYAMEKSERSLEKISNEKIMAVNEYSQTIVEELSKRHQEVMFLYDMLNDKQVDLNNTVRKAEATAKEMESVSSEAVVLTEELNKAMSEPQYQNPYPNVQYPNFQYSQNPYNGQNNYPVNGQNNYPVNGQNNYPVNGQNNYPANGQGYPQEANNPYNNQQYANQYVDTIVDDEEEQFNPLSYTKEQIEDIRQYGAPDLEHLQDRSQRRENPNKKQELQDPYQQNDVEILRARYKAMSEAMDAMPDRQVKDQPAKKSKIQPVFTMFDEDAEDDSDNEITEKTEQMINNNRRINSNPNANSDSNSNINQNINSNMNPNMNNTPKKQESKKKEKVTTKGKFGFGENHNQQILELYKEGKDTVTIAKELNLGVGEVKLVIGLFEE